jgi:RNA polymerase sigma factor (sigma-70 family)
MAGNGMEGTLPNLERLLEHSTWLRGLARSLVGASSADDLVQDTLVAAMRSPPPSDRPARPWLAHVMRNFVRMRHRAETRRVHREQAADPQPEAVAEPHDLYSQVEMQRVLCELVLALPEPHRRTIVLRYVEGLEPNEIARREGIPAGTVRWRHKQAIERLRAGLDARSGGNRRGWMGLVLPIAKLPTTSVAAGPLTGLLAMTMKTKLALGLLALVIGAISLWFGVGGPTHGAPPPTSAAASAPSVRLRLGGSSSLDQVPNAAIHGRVVGALGDVRVSLFRLVGENGPPSTQGRSIRCGSRPRRGNGVASTE